VRRLALVLLYGDAVVAALFAFRYLTATSVMPYHLAFLGSAAVPPAFAALLLLVYKVVGFGFVGLAAMTAILAAPAARGDRAAWWALLVTGCVDLIPLTVVVLTIGHGAPWWGPALGVVVLVVALLLIRNPVRA
jgi:hypothetical protein